MLISASPNPTRKEYVKIEETLNAKEKYEPVFLNDFAPDDRYARRHWIDALSLWFPVMLYKFVNKNFGKSPIWVHLTPNIL